MGGTNVSRLVQFDRLAERVLDLYHSLRRLPRVLQLRVCGELRARLLEHEVHVQTEQRTPQGRNLRGRHWDSSANRLLCNGGHLSRQCPRDRRLFYTTGLAI